MSLSQTRTLLTRFGLAAVLLALTGCEVKTVATAPAPPPALEPRANSQVTVYFVRTALGVADKQPIPIRSGNHNGADLTVSGKFVDLDEHWVVLESATRGEQWIARENILYMSVAAP